MRRQICFIWLLLLVANTALTAQRSTLETNVLRLFPKPEKVLWLRHYSGTIDDINDVTMALAYDGKMCRGRMKYIRSEHEFGLVGFMNQQDIRLVELDQQTQVSAYISGVLNGRELLLEWVSVDNSVGSKILLRETGEEVRRVNGDCGVEKWIQVFRGLVDGEDVEFLLQRETDRQLRGLVYFSKAKKSYEVKGEMNKGAEIKLDMFDNYKQIKGELSGTLTGKGLIEAVIKSPHKGLMKTDFLLYQTMEVACVSYVDYLSSLGISYPMTQNEAFNRWIREVVSGEKIKYDDFVDKAQDLGTELNPETRSSIRSYGWYDIDFISDKIISGRLWVTHSWEQNGNGIPITYDLENERPITLKEIFHREFNLQDFIWAYMSKDIQNHSYYDDYDFRKWLSTASFKSFTIRQEGINFSTPFSAIYGQQDVTIPFEELKPYLINEGAVWELVR